MPDQVKEEFQKFSNSDAGFDAIVKAVESDVREDFTLDFKVLRHENRLVEDGKFPPNLREHLSICTSAFANTDGGILIWGVQCNKGKPMTAEPVLKAKELCEHMKELSLTITDPPCVMEHRCVMGPGDRGFIVTYIPQAIKRPVMATVQNTMRYYMRTKDSCIAMPHSFVSALMTARTLPILRVGALSPDMVFQRNGPHRDMNNDPLPVFIYSSLLILENSGGVIARDCAVIIHGVGEGGIEFRPDAGVVRNLDATGDDHDAASIIVTLRQYDILHPRLKVCLGTLRVSTEEQSGQKEFLAEVLCDGFSKSTKIVVNFDKARNKNRALGDAESQLQG